MTGQVTDELQDVATKKKTADRNAGLAIGRRVRLKEEEAGEARWRLGCADQERDIANAIAGRSRATAGFITFQRAPAPFISLAKAWKTRKMGWLGEP